ncbi:MAG: hypothetical protein JXR83_00980 [Deltaproteobacteria bacterium]|nr:hypothetical protein [Deltaproteobacteria bacterium]
MRFPEIQKMVDARLARGLSRAEVKDIVSQVTGGDDKINKTEQKQLEKIAKLYADDFTVDGRKAFEKLTGIRVQVKPASSRTPGTGTMRPYETRVRARDRVFAIVAPSDNYRPPIGIVATPPADRDRPPIGIVATPPSRPGGRVFGIVGPSRPYSIIARDDSDVVRPSDDDRPYAIVSFPGSRRGRVFGIA